MRIRVGVLAYSPPWYDGAFVDETIRYLGWKLPQYAFSVRYYAPEALRRAIRSREIDIAAASTAFFHGEQMPLMRELAAIVSDTASDPRRAAAAAVIVRAESALALQAQLAQLDPSSLSAKDALLLLYDLHEAAERDLAAGD